MPAASKLRILVVDDDDVVREVLRTILEQASYEVATAGDGAEALSAIDGGRLAAVVTDIVMPNEEGLRFIFAARRAYPELPIIAMSGIRSGTYLSLAQKLGANAILGKPFDPAALLATVASVLPNKP